MPRTLVVKVGTSTLTDDQGRLDRAYLYEMAWQIAALRREGWRVVLVSSGAIRAGCERLGWTKRPQTIPLKQAAAAVGQGELIHAYTQAFGPAYPVAQVLLTRQDAADRVRYINARNTLSALLRCGCMPIVNENDTVAVDEIRFGDNDTLAALVASMVHADLLIILTDVPGFLDEQGEVIPRIETIDERIHRLAGSSGRDGSGGMVTKLVAAEIATTAGARTVIAPGRPTTVLLDVAGGRPVGTEFPACARRLRRRKHWILYGPQPAGALRVNALARAALVEGNKSLLPAGIVGVEGRFVAGDTVSLVDATGEVFARGIVNCDWREAQALMGAQTSDIARILGRTDLEEVIHRDNLVVFEEQETKEEGARGRPAV
ncbi:MAG: glutamate 5-kinase [Armatimonadetes bacterium]|nr:glutamate 5-kinase [Armatimonadota bacterium]